MQKSNGEIKTYLIENVIDSKQTVILILLFTNFKFTERGVRRGVGASEGEPLAGSRRGLLLGHRCSRPHRLPPAGHVSRSYQEHRLPEDRQGTHHERSV
jgi:hypothetical protein